MNVQLERQENNSNSLAMSKRYSVSPEQNHHYSNDIPIYNYTAGCKSSVSLSNTISGNNKLQREQKCNLGKQGISFQKSQQKLLNDEDDVIHFTDESDSSEDSGNEKKPKQKRKSLRTAKTDSELDWAHQLKDKSHYQIVIKTAVEQDDQLFGKMERALVQNDSDLDNLHPHHNLQTRADSNQSSDQDQNTPVQRKWSKIRNVFKGVQLFSQLEVETISKPGELALHLSASSKSNTPRRGVSPENNNQQNNQDDINASEIMRNIQMEAQYNAAREQSRLIDDFKYRKRFFEAIENGSQEDLKYIEEYLKNDPKKYLIVEESEERRMNKRDTFGQTPLYCAAKNGNLEVIKILVSHKVNHRLLSYLNNDQSASDTPINVASRWGHVKVVEYFINTFQWEAKDLKDAKKSTTNNEIKKLLSKKI